MLMTHLTFYFNRFFPSNAFNAWLDTYPSNITVWQPFLIRPHILKNCHKTSNREWELEVMERSRGFKGQSTSEAYEDWWFMVKCVWPTLLLIFLFAALEHAQKKRCNMPQKKAQKKANLTWADPKSDDSGNLSQLCQEFLDWFGIWIKEFTPDT